LTVRVFTRFQRQEIPSIDLPKLRETLQIEATQALRIAGLRDLGSSSPSALLVT
jgi:hypothetical protein